MIRTVRTIRRIRSLRGAPLSAIALLLASGALLARTSESAPAPAAAAAPRAHEPRGDAGRANDLGDELLLAGDLDAAEAAYRQAIALDPQSATAHVKLGRVALDRRQRLAARRALVRALELEPDNAETHYLLGVVYDELGFDRVARKRYRRAFELAPELADPIRHPEVSRNRQALAALLSLWQNEGEAQAGARASSPIAAQATRAEAERSLEGEGTGSAGGQGGGYARSSGAAGAAAPEPEPEAGARAAEARRSGERPSTSRGGKRGDLVVDPSDLRPGGSINQLVAPGTAPRGGARLPTGGSRGFGPRSAPPKPFEPEEDSTGRIEPRLEPSDPGAFAISG